MWLQHAKHAFGESVENGTHDVNHMTLSHDSAPLADHTESGGSSRATSEDNITADAGGSGRIDWKTISMAIQELKLRGDRMFHIHPIEALFRGILPHH